MMREQLALDLPVTPDEPRPWEVSVWRYHTETREPFLTREEAIEFMASNIGGDDCYIEGLYRPDGSEDEQAREQAWQLEWT
jgi:hypothetical protein